MALDSDLIAALKDLDPEEVRELAKALKELADEEDNFSQQTGTAAQKLRERRTEEREYLKLLEIRKKAQKEGIELSQAEIERLTELEQKGVAARVAAQKLSDELGKVGNVLLKEFSGGLKEAFSSLSGFTSKLFELVNQFDSAATGLAKTSGYVESFNQDIIDSSKATAGFSVSMEEASKAIGGLSTNMTLFNTLGKAGRHEIETTTLALQRLGVSSEVTGKALDIMTRGMGMGTGAANSAARSFDALAQSVGLPVTQVIEGFAEIAGDLSRFGNNGTKVFKELTKQARSMGISIKEAFDLAEQFDTFEGAAELAGKLNAQIGMQLNSVELMSASHEDRIKIMQREFKLRGQNFDDMSRRQKQAIAEVMGVDVDMASRIFGDPVKLMKYRREQKKLEERAKAVTTIQEDLKNIFQEIMLTISPLITVLRTLTKFISSNAIPKWIFLTGVLLKFAGALPLVTAGIKTLAGKSAILSKLGDKFSSVFTSAASGADDLTKGTDKVGESFKANFAQMAGMALIIAAIGAAVYMAATGVSNLVLAFKGMGAEAIAAVAGIVAFGYAMALLIPKLAALGTFGWPGVAALVALGAAMYAMGLATKLVAESFVMFIEAVGKLGFEQGLVLVGTLYGMAAALSVFAGSVTIAGTSIPAIFVISAGIIALGTALWWVMPTIERFGKVVKVFGGLFGSVAKVAVGVADIFKGLNSASVTHILRIADAMVKLRKSVTQLISLDPAQVGGFIALFRAMADAGHYMTNFATAATALGNIERIISVETSLDQLKGKTELIMGLAQAAAQMEKIQASAVALGEVGNIIELTSAMDSAASQRLAAGARPAPTAAGKDPRRGVGRSMTFPIVFKLGTTVMDEYILKVTGDDADLLKIR